MINEEDLAKYRNNPKLMDERLQKIFSKNDKNIILNLFYEINNQEFYEYLLKNNYICFFEVNDIIPLLNNMGFLYYLLNTNINIFQNIKDIDYTKELVVFIDSNYYTFLNSSFDFTSHPILLNNPNLSSLIIDDISSPEDVINIFNHVKNAKIINKVITKIKQNNIIIDIDQLNSIALANPLIGNYLVFTLNLNNISLLKGEAYRVNYAKIIENIKSGEITFKDVDISEFPEALITKAVYDALIINPDNYPILDIFPKDFQDYKNSYIRSLNSLDEEEIEKIFKDNCHNEEFFKLFLDNMNEYNSHYLEYFNYNDFSEITIKNMLNKYRDGNKYIGTFLLREITKNKKDKHISINFSTCLYTNLIYETLITYEQNDTKTINDLISFVDAKLCNQKTIFMVYDLFAKGIINTEKLNASFWYSNDFLNIFLANNQSQHLYKFKSKAYEPVNEFFNNEALIEGIDNLKTTEFYLYLKNYEIIFNLNNNKKLDRNINSSITSKFGKKEAELIEFLITSKKRNPLSLKYVDTENTIYAFNKFGDVLDNQTKDYLDSLSIYQLNKINSSHIRHIYHMLDNYIYADEDKVVLALNIYLTLGYDRSVEFLNPDIRKNYGQLSENIIKSMFKNINVSNVTFIQYGNGYQPIINNELINTVFGANYKAEATPIKYFLNKPEIKNINSLQSQRLFNKIKNINKFFEGNFAYALNNWNLIKEEYFRKQNISKLKSRLNIPQINEIIEALTQVKMLLGPEDRYLIFSDVFKYAGIDNQYVGSDYRNVPKRVVELSRTMDYVNEKYFPNINFNYEDYTLNTYNPLDRKILSAGYKSDCCFRALANADNDGGDNSFIKYCCSTKAGGGIEIIDKEGKMLAFSPIIINGNVLLIHSVESAEINEEKIKLVFKILQEYGHRVIKASDEKENKIDYVCVTNATFFDGDMPKEKLKEENKFSIYDPKCNFNGMYNNLDKDQFIIASRNNINQDYINYNQGLSEYNFPQLTMPYAHLVFDSNIYNFIKALDSCNNIIIELSNRRFHKEKNSFDSYKLLQEINLYKEKHLNLYKKLFGIYDYDIYAEYQMGVKLAHEFANDLTIDDFIAVKDFYYSANWYIIVQTNNKIKYEYSIEGQDECMNLVEKLSKELTNENVRRSKKL